MLKSGSIRFDACVVHYTLHTRRGHTNMTLRVGADATVTLTAPWWVSQRVAERYLYDKRAWLTGALAKVADTAAASSRSKEVLAAEYRAYKEDARALVHAHLTELNQHYGFAWGRVSIRKNTSRWGSCSRKKNLNFDYRIVFLPPHLQRYLVVHELCHLREMNHSPHFWALVASVIPEYATCRKELRAVRR